MIVTRFAPSPTGRLHLGHAYSAILAHDRARATGGRFLLRIEDIDGARSRLEFINGIEDDLSWLGLTWDGPAVRQSTRLDRYAAALERLRAAGLVYLCFCTRADIAREVAGSMAAPHGANGPAYPGLCRNLAPVERAARMAEPHAWRLDMTAAVARVGALAWHDEIAGEQRANAVAGDVVLARKDAPASYHLAVTIDDAAQGVTHVVRGADLFAATHVHRLLQALLDLPTPIYHHHALLTGADGRRLAKRHGAPTLASLREGNADGRALADGLRRGRLPTGFARASA